MSTSPSPIGDDFHSALEQLVSTIRPYSEDLYEIENFIDQRWLQVEPHPQNTRLHILREDGSYLLSIDGNLVTGTWSTIEDSNTLILEQPGPGTSSEKTLYDLGFLNQDFFILKKHGHRRGLEDQFLLLGREAIAQDSHWEEIIELIYQRYKNNKTLIAGTVIVIALILLYCIFRYV